MADLTAIKKKLPFKPTALRSARGPKHTPSGSSGSSTGKDATLQTLTGAGDGRGGVENEGEEDDTLALFRRAKEMAPIVEADRERRRRRQLQKQEEEEARRRASAGSKHSVDEGDEGQSLGEQATTPTARQMSELSEEVILATQEESNRELVTPPPSKRVRRDGSASETKHKDVDLDSTESTQGSPTMRAMRSLAPDRSMTPALFSTSLHSSGASTSTYNTRSRTGRLGAAPPAGSQVILLDSDSEPETGTTFASASAASAAAASSAEVLDEAPTMLDLDLDADALDDDDEFAEYVRKAQEQRDKLMGQAATATSSPSTLMPQQPSGTVLSSPAPVATEPADKAAQIIDIVITSEVPGARMCLVKYHFDRPLRMVRDTWTALQHRHNVPLRGLLDRDEDVVLTWRRKKVYMTSTLLSLGIRPAADTGHGSGGAVTATVVEASTGGGQTRDGFNESRTRIHMQAWTPALFAEMEHEEERRRRRELSDDEDETGAAAAAEPYGGEHGGEGGAADDAQAAMLRIILKAKGGEPVKLKVLPETTAQTLVAAFRAQRDVPEAADVGLWFDGMRLEEDATMEDADIEDMDTIEVHVK
ncbi:Ubiquitin [Cordyceps javanica]|uniref:Ubiquitin n=1 Tax=Cordyceps javanica TaxID=43265 RepID=A0A545W292_9HYPO|nr:Ubiquitin [Cordyceps javanica]TQW08046.1 Ubiquitin [Cordyceps javanica]